jgi:hypothetical protein
MGALIERKTTTAPTVVAGDVRVTPQARAVIVRLPFGAFVWNRPNAVVVEHAGRVERVRILDVTRLAQVALWACAAVALVANWRLVVRGKEH